MPRSTSSSVRAALLLALGGLTPGTQGGPIRGAVDHSALGPPVSRTVVRLWRPTLNRHPGMTIRSPFLSGAESEPDIRREFQVAKVIANPTDHPPTRLAGDAVRPLADRRGTDWLRRIAHRDFQRWNRRPQVDWTEDEPARDLGAGQPFVLDDLVVAALADGVRRLAAGFDPFTDEHGDRPRTARPDRGAVDPSAPFRSAGASRSGAPRDDVVPEPTVLLLMLLGLPALLRKPLWDRRAAR